jgi:hypothetical protein
MTAVVAGPQRIELEPTRQPHLSIVVRLAGEHAEERSWGTETPPIGLVGDANCRTHGLRGRFHHALGAAQTGQLRSMAHVSVGTGAGALWRALAAGAGREKRDAGRLRAGRSRRRATGRPLRLD